MTLQNGTEATQDAQTDGGTRAIELSQRIPLPLDQVWARFISKDGFQDFVGAGAELGQKGEDWRAEDGTFGVTRSYHPEEQVRLSWHQDDDAPKTMVEIDFAKADDGSLVTLRHDGLTDDCPREQLEAKWSAALERLGA